jgi:hypothetical protein
MLTFDNAKIILVSEETRTYNKKTKKFVDLKKPKISRKVLYEGNFFDLGEFYENVKFFTEKNSGYKDKIEVQFNSSIEL